jgi:hypothetical protein
MCGLTQAVEAKQAGAAGFLGTIASVLGSGAPIMSSYAAALGLDAPVEVSHGFSLHYGQA